MYREKSTFDPNSLPDDRLLQVQADTDFQLLGQGMTPDEIAAIRDWYQKAGRTEVDEKEGAVKND